MSSILLYGWKWFFRAHHRPLSAGIQLENSIHWHFIWQWNIARETFFLSMSLRFECLLFCRKLNHRFGSCCCCGCHFFFSLVSFFIISIFGGAFFFMCTLWINTRTTTKTPTHNSCQKTKPSTVQLVFTLRCLSQQIDARIAWCMKHKNAIFAYCLQHLAWNWCTIHSAERIDGHAKISSIENIEKKNASLLINKNSHELSVCFLKNKN